MERAMDKIRDEMAESNRPELQAAGSCITKLLRRFPMIAGAILADGKTLKGYYEAMRDKAKKEHLTMIDGEEFAAAYFEFDPVLMDDAQRAQSTAKAFDLDALLNGGE